MHEMRLSDQDRERLLKVAANPMGADRHAVRSRIILMTSDGIGPMAIMKRLSINKSTVWRWQERFREEGVDGLLRDRPRKPGRQPISKETKALVLEKTCCERPWDGPFWTAQSMAQEMNLSRSTVQAIWRQNGIAPHWLRHWRKVDDIVGFYSDALTHALVFTGGKGVQGVRRIRARGRTAHQCHQRRQLDSYEVRYRLRDDLRRVVDLSRSIDARSLPTSQRSLLDQSFTRYLEDILARQGPDTEVHVLIGSLKRGGISSHLEWFGSRPPCTCSFAPNLNWLDEQLQTLFAKAATIDCDQTRFVSVPDLATAAHAVYSLPTGGAFRWISSKRS